MFMKPTNPIDEYLFVEGFLQFKDNRRIPRKLKTHLMHLAYKLEPNDTFDRSIRRKILLDYNIKHLYVSR